MSPFTMKAFQKMDFPLDQARVEALEAAHGQPATVKTIDRLARIYGMEAAAWAVGQTALREKAKAKFSQAEKMIFTKDGLEMTSHERVSGFHASLFSEPTEVLDGTCGIGGDLISLAKKGIAKGCDLSNEALTAAQWNLEVLGLTAELSQGSCMDLDWRGRSLWLDPARRGAGKRILDPDSFSPSLSEVLVKADEADLAWIKLTPLLRDTVLESAGKGLIFVSHQGECVETIVQAGSSPSEPWRRAYKVEEGLWLDASAPPSSADEPGRFVYEADPASIRGHCLGGFGLDALGETPGWLTGDGQELSPWLTPFRVVWSGAWRESHLHTLIKSEGIWLDSVKTRGVRVDPSQTLKRLRKGADQKNGPRRELMLYSQGPRIRALLVERIRAQPED